MRTYMWCGDQLCCRTLSTKTLCIAFIRRIHLSFWCRFVSFCVNMDNKEENLLLKEVKEKYFRNEIYVSSNSFFHDIQNYVHFFCQLYHEFIFSRIFRKFLSHWTLSKKWRIYTLPKQCSSTVEFRKAFRSRMFLLLVSKSEWMNFVMKNMLRHSMSINVCQWHYTKKFLSKQPTMSWEACLFLKNPNPLWFLVKQLQERRKLQNIFWTFLVDRYPHNLLNICLTQTFYWKRLEILWQLKIQIARVLLKLCRYDLVYNLSESYKIITV